MKLPFAFLFVLAFFSLFPFHLPLFSDTQAVSGQTPPIETIEGAVTWSENRTVNGIIIVERHATLSIPRGVTITFDGKSKIQVEGKLIIDGSPDKPVVLKKKDDDVGDAYTIVSLFSGNIAARNVDVSGGGGADEVFLIGYGRQRPLLNVAQADWIYSGAFGSMNSGALDLEGMYFHDNILAVYANNDSTRKVKVWRSKFERNTWDFINGNIRGNSDLRYNWWSREGGPEVCTVDCDYPRRTLEKIIGGVDTSSFAKSAYFKDPVIIIPGILGSWQMKDASAFVMDPIFGTYAKLVETLTDNGYEKEKNLFVFPYEWRKSNVETARLLRDRVDAIKSATNWPKVDIVAHSMGGLVAREYIEMQDGGDSIDQLITLGTPQNGSPESYLIWGIGDFYDTSFIKEMIAKKIFQQEAEESGYTSIYDYITKAPITSVRELLPVYSYLRNAKNNELRTYPTDYPRNVFLERLQSEENLAKLSPVLFTNIIGKVRADKTITGFRVGSSSAVVLSDGTELTLPWGFGKPDGYDDILGDRGLELGSGDGTVPLSSATDIPSDEQIELASEHNELPEAAAKITFRRLTGLDAMVETPRSIPMDSMMLIRVFSPIDIQIVAPSGKKMGKNFKTSGTYDEIPGAFYTGFNTKNEFITIPNPEDGEYRILTEGTGVGDYRIEATKIMIGVDALGGTESTATLHGTAEIGKQEEKKVTIKDDVVTGESTDTIAPTTTASLSGTQGRSDWYTSDVTITLTATDNEGESGIKETKYSLDDGVTWNIYTTSLIISSEGTTSILYFSTDTAGNREEAKAQTIKIDQTAPESKIQFNSTTQKLDIIGSDNLGQAVAVAIQTTTIPIPNPVSKERNWYSWLQSWYAKSKPKTILTTTLTDEAGHETILIFEKRKDRASRIDLALQSIGYDGVVTNLKDAGIQYKWQRDWRGRYVLFASYLSNQNMSVESHYLPKRNETWIMERPRELADEGDDESDRRPSRKKLSGMVVPGMVTEQGAVKIKY